MRIILVRNILWRVTSVLMGLLALNLAGCSEDPGLQERVDRLQAENQEKNRQLQEAQLTLEQARSELKSARAAANKPPAPATRAPAFLPKEQVDSSYAAASREFQQRAGGELKNSTVVDCIKYPVTMPTDERPYRSKIALLVSADTGRTYRLEFPVSADQAGKWSFPAPAEVAEALADSRAQDAGNVNPASRGASDGRRPASDGVPPPGPGQPPSETRVIDGEDGRTPSARGRTNPR